MGRPGAACDAGWVERVLDVRGLNCPIPLIRARAALDPLKPGDTLTVLATDPEAPIDLAALAADEGHTLTEHREPHHWRLAITLGPGPAARTRQARAD
jgi:tRNA 2-thiouridine synthesizing protein A